MVLAFQPQSHQLRASQVVAAIRRTGKICNRDFSGEQKTTKNISNYLSGGETGIIRGLRLLTPQGGRSAAAPPARSLRRCAPPGRTEGFASSLSLHEAKK
jgi:hypothetical protein